MKAVASPRAAPATARTNGGSWASTRARPTSPGRNGRRARPPSSRSAGAGSRPRQTRWRCGRRERAVCCVHSAGFPGKRMLQAIGPDLGRRQTGADALRPTSPFATLSSKAKTHSEACLRRRRPSSHGRSRDKGRPRRHDAATRGVLGGAALAGGSAIVVALQSIRSMDPTWDVAVMPRARPRRPRGARSPRRREQTTAVRKGRRCS